ncbi:hypothetical protein [Solimonas marina]|uniref:Uncharacterized protein n=1 Tax=Solimonas marina TaxID=2714601 RepID=A0A969WAA2_9GAMM|nr:hypothetical protein [Solimonas marina]NKF22784.1 hypothetical protein [Solimonas marina]
MRRSYDASAAESAGARRPGRRRSSIGFKISQMKTERSIHESFCNVYADAVVRFVVTGVNEDVSFDAKTQRFVSKPVEDGTDPFDCEWWVGQDWPTFVGPLQCPTDLAQPKFSEDVLKKAIVHALTKSATGKRMSQILAGLD